MIGTCAAGNGPPENGSKANLSGLEVNISCERFRLRRVLPELLGPVVARRVWLSRISLHALRRCRIPFIDVAVHIVWLPSIRLLAVDGNVIRRFLTVVSSLIPPSLTAVECVGVLEGSRVHSFSLAGYAALNPSARSYGWLTRRVSPLGCCLGRAETRERLR